jgi:putative sterol carrier protein
MEPARARTGSQQPASTVLTVNEFGFDPQRALDAFKRLAADAPAQLADGFTRLVRDAPPERLEQLMHSPARKPILDGIFWQMPKQVNLTEATDTKSSVRWTITGRADGAIDTYQLELDNGRCWVERGTSLQPPRLTITIDGVDFVRLVSGNLDPMQAYFKGQIKLAGDIMVAAKLATLFRIPGAPSANGDKPRDDRPNGEGSHDQP